MWRSSTITELVVTSEGLAGVIGRGVVAGLDGRQPPHPRWRFTVPPAGPGTDIGPIAQPLVADDTHVYVVGGNKRLYALEAATGHLAWRSEPLVEEFAKVAAGTGGVYFVDDHRAVHALDAATGAPRWIAPETSCASAADCAIPAATAPAVRDGQVFFPAPGDETQLIGFDAATGHRTSTGTAPPEPSLTHRTLSGNGSASFELGAVVARDEVGHELWSRNFGAHVLHFERPDDPDVVYLSVEPPPPPED